MTAITILLVEDNPGDAELLRDLLGEGAPSDVQHDVEHVERVADAAARLAPARQSVEPIDVVLLDLSLPDARGLDTVARVRAAAPHLPVVVLTGLDDEALAVSAVQAGAQDYLVKGSVTGAGVWRAIRHARERQRLIEAAHRATAVRDEVLGIVAHDLRNPLGAIRMCASVMGGAVAGDAARARELAGVIATSVELMERIIRDLLDVSAIEAGRLAMMPEPVPVAEACRLAEEIAAPQAADAGVALGVECPSNERFVVQADPERLQQALGNLLGNAIKFTSRGGHVTLAAASIDDGAMVRFTVRDTGPGIAPDHVPHVFDRFWQARSARRGGAGLGLAIVKGIADAHGGRVGLDSTLGVGTTFWIDLPVGDSPTKDRQDR